MSLHHSRPSLDQSDHEALKEVFETGYLAKGPKTQQFEESLATRFKRKHAVTVSNGMAALHLTLHALGIKQEDEVSLPSYVCTALLNAIHLTQAKPKVWDTPLNDFLLDPNIASNVTSKALIYPQMFGAQTQINNPSNHTPYIIEDCAMSLGKGALSQGIASITSFYATKMMTTAQGGAILTDDEALANELRDLIAYDNRESYKLRFNYAPNDLGAALGLSQLSKLDSWLEKRNELALTYDKLIQSKCPELLTLPDGLSKHYPHLFRYWVRSNHKDSLIAFLAQYNIEAKAPVYKPIHQYLNLSEEDFHRNKAFDQFVSLPFYPGLAPKDIEYLVDKLTLFEEQIKP